MSSVSDAELVAGRARQVVSEHGPESVPIPEFLAACYDAGLSWVHFPEGMGGLGVSRGLQALADRILGRIDLGPSGFGSGNHRPGTTRRDGCKLIGGKPSVALPRP